MEDDKLATQLRTVIWEVQDFPKPGISFKDITPVLKDADLCKLLLNRMESFARPLKPDFIAGLESRGFMLGFALAQRMNLGFIPIRKPGKLPREVYSQSYELEYGLATLELHREDLQAGKRVLIHDDLLATGGTARAAYDLVRQAGAQVVGLDFIIELSFLNACDKFPQDLPKHSIVVY